MQCSVREIESWDIPQIADYWLTLGPKNLEAMGADPMKLPSRDDWNQMLQAQIILPIPEKQSYCLIWELDNEAIGHSNINKITFGNEASMHLHLWRKDIRHQGIGTEMVRLCLPHFFEKYQLKTLICEPYALNPAPNGTLKKLGFRFIKEYVTTPGWINFEQPVKRWELSREEFEQLNLSFPKI